MSTELEPAPTQEAGLFTVTPLPTKFKSAIWFALPTITPAFLIVTLPGVTTPPEIKLVCLVQYLSPDPADATTYKSAMSPV